MQPLLKIVPVNGIELAYFERGTRRADAPTLMFVHATGFHARIWDYIVEAFPEHHVIAVDQRGHGRSSSVAANDWHVFGQDHAALLTHLELSDVIGISHSMGAHAMVEGAYLSQAYRRLLLLDPTIAEPQAYSTENSQVFGDDLHPAAKRRRLFGSAQDMVDRLRTKSSFPLFSPRILQDYCEFGLQQVESGEFALLCDPEVEARVYMSSRSNEKIYASVRGLDIPVRIIRAKLPEDDAVQDFSSSPTWPGLAGAFPNARDQHWSDCSHFIPMQRPDDVITLIREEIELW